MKYVIFIYLLFFLPNALLASKIDVVLTGFSINADYKDLEKIIINKDVVKESSNPIMIYNNKNTSQKILVNKS